MKKIWINDVKDKIGETVELFGWVNVRRDHGKIIFIDLRDRSGIAQLVFTPQNEELYKIAETLRPEWVLFVKGKVVERPKGMVNPELETGEVEVKVEKLEVWDLVDEERRKELFPLNTDGYEINEELRLKYRYFDLRRVRLKNNLIFRHKVIKFVRDYLDKEGFIEVETPILTKSTPEGARDYVVPSRLYPGKFYALPQSPQQYKQLLMVAGIERYFQVARAFRDEDTRKDRQPEFTQLDIEASFVNQDDILNLIEGLIKELVKKLMPNKKIAEIPFPRLTHDESMKKYKSDRPDLRKDKNNPDELAFVLVIDFPMFEEKEDGSLGAVHHPFTQPTFDTSLDPSLFRMGNEKEGKKLLDMLGSEKEAMKLKAYQYDLVLNGEEVGGGSIRIFDRNILKKVFELLGHDFSQKFGHLWEAFGFGVPPHGGIALGLDRLVAVLAGEPSIREVIAFPKTGDARDPMMESPSEVEKEQLKELHLKIEKGK